MAALDDIFRVFPQLEALSATTPWANDLRNGIYKLRDEFLALEQRIEELPVVSDAEVRLMIPGADVIPVFNRYAQAFGYSGPDEIPAKVDFIRNCLLAELRGAAAAGRSDHYSALAHQYDLMRQRILRGQGD